MRPRMTAARNMTISAAFAAIPLTLWTTATKPTFHNSPTRANAVERIAINDNRVAAGSLRDGVLTIRLEVRAGEWHPDGDNDPGILVHAIGEEGKPLQIPGPLIRVPKGTEIRATVRNALADSTLRLTGLSGAADTIVLKPGEVREMRFTANTAGTYYYRGRTTTGQPGAITSQLNGAIVVDDVGRAPAPDRVIVLGFWNPLPPGAPPFSVPVRFVMNGKAWPHTERLTYTVGDTVRMRIVNTSGAPHPMHLHGFYFNVDSRGDGTVDSTYDAGSHHFAVTERAAPLRTFTLTWVPERAGNWMFHCHDNIHVLRNRPLDGSPLPPESEHAKHVKNHALEMMGGLVMGVEVRPNGPVPVVRDGPRRALRLLARVDSGGTPNEPSYGYVLQDGARTSNTTSPLLPGPTIVLRKGEPVSITVVNELPEETAGHWHGIELESYFDGVAGFSGEGKRISPAIAVRDSFVARFTPPRAGTFMYHPHADEVRQQEAGLSGAIVVLDDPRSFDPEKDVVLLISTPRLNADDATVFLNGTNKPAPREWRVGERYRLRVINIHTYRPSMRARLHQDSTLLSWRPIAKDGMDLPPDRAVMRPAELQMGNGEAFDYEFTPRQTGNINFTVTTGNGVLLVTMPIRVR